MLRILHNTSWDFLKQWKLSVITVAVFVIPAVILVPVRGFNYSIEFTGGTQMELTFRAAPSIADVRAAISGAGLGDAEIFTYGAPTEIVIRAQEAAQVAQLEAGAETVSAQIERTLRARFGDDAFVAGGRRRSARASASSCDRRRSSPPSSPSR